MAVIIPQIDIPENCVKCHEMGLQEMLNCTLIYRGCANCGRHPKCQLKSVENPIDGDALTLKIRELQTSLSSDNDKEWGKNKPAFKALAYINRIIRVMQGKEG